MNQRVWRILFTFSVIQILVSLIFLFSPKDFFRSPVYAATCTSSGAGDWHTISWSCGHTPTTGDDVVIDHDVSFTSQIAEINNLTINSSDTLTQNNNIEAVISGTLTISSGGTLTHTVNAASHSFSVKFAAQNINVADGGTIDVDAKGFEGGDTQFESGAGPGGGASRTGGSSSLGDGGGGAHGGDGGDADEDGFGGTKYCTTSDPSTLGSGGGATVVPVSPSGGDGGGLIQLAATSTMTIEGTITADGGNGGSVNLNRAGGGGGGGIKLTAATFTGTPTEITANGGESGFTFSAGSWRGAGGGGGGCIYMSGLGAAFTTSTVSANGGDGDRGAAFGEDGEAGSLVLSITQNSTPSATVPTPVQASSTAVSVTTTVADGDSHVTSLQVQYSFDLASWATSTLVNVSQNGEGDGTVVTPGLISDIDTDNDGSVALSFDWNMSADIPNTETSTVYMRLIANDSFASSTATSSAFAVDTAAPSPPPGAMSIASITTSSVSLNHPSVTSSDTNFIEYIVYYSTSSAQVANGTASTNITSSTEAELGNSDLSGGDTRFNATGLAQGTLYYFQIFAYDTWGHSTSSATVLSTTTLVANVAPTVTAITPEQTTAQIVTVTTTVADANNEFTSLTVSFSTNSVSWVTSTVIGSATTDGEGLPATSTGMITFIPTHVDGSVDLTFTWDFRETWSSVFGTSSVDQDVYLRITPSDGTATGTTATSSVFNIDSKKPTTPSPVGFTDVSTSSFRLVYPTTTSTDSNFSVYRLAVTSTPTFIQYFGVSYFTTATDVNLADSNFNGATSSPVYSAYEVVTGLSPGGDLQPNTEYGLTLDVTDTWGHRSPFVGPSTTTTLAAVPGKPTATAITTTSATFTWSSSTNPSDTEFRVLEVSGSPSSTWSATTTQSVTGLTCNTSYDFRTQARNRLNVETGYSASTNITTDPCPGTPGVLVSQVGLSVSEGGSSQTYTIVLNTAPTSDVAITVSDGSQVSASPSVLTFSTSSWGTAQTVAVSAVDDTTDEGAHTGTITHTAASSDGNYNAITINAVTVTISDNDGQNPGGPGPTDPVDDGEECGITDKSCAEDPNQPTPAAIQIQNTLGQQITHTNTRDVLLAMNVEEIQGAWDLVALEESEGAPSETFGSVPFLPIAASQTWTLLSDAPDLEDGLKCVNAKFHDSSGDTADFVTFACVEYDTSTGVPPLAFLESGMVNGQTVSAGFANGTSEPLSTIIITREAIDAPDPTITSNNINVTSCVDAPPGGVTIERPGLFGTLTRHCRDTGHGPRDYFYECVDADTYKVSFRPCRVLERTYQYDGPFYANQIDHISNVLLDESDAVDEVFAPTNEDTGSEELNNTDAGVNAEEFTTVSVAYVSDQQTLLPISLSTVAPIYTPYLSLAGSKVTFTTTADEDGNWNFIFPTSFPSDLYEITIQQQDLAQNVSEIAFIEMYITPPEPVGCEEGICVACEGDACANECDGENPPDTCPQEDLCFADPDASECQEEQDTCAQNPNAPECQEEVEDPCATDPTAEGCAEDEGAEPSFCELNPDHVSCVGTDPEVPAEGPDEQGENNDGGSEENQDDAAEGQQENNEETGDEQKTAEDEGGFITTIEDILETIQTFIDNPTIETFTKNIAVPAVAVAAVANVSAAALQFPAIWNLLKYLFGQPFLLWRLKKRKKWGVVYNAFTKQPIPLATIRLLDADTNRLVQSHVTDFDGRFVLIAAVGSYRIEVDKPGYEKQSTYLKDQSEDHAYVKLYHGEKIEVTDADTNINHAIPLDPTGDAVSVAQLLKDHARRISHLTISLLGLGLGIAFFIVTPTLIVGLTVLLHAILFGVFYRISHTKLPGTVGVVKDRDSGGSLSRTVVRVFDATYDKVVDSHITDRHGRYAALVGPSTYYLTYDKPGYETKTSETLDFSSQKTKGQGGMIARNETLQKKKKNRENT